LCNDPFCSPPSACSPFLDRSFLLHRSQSKPFFLLLATLSRFTSQNANLLPLSSSLPDMKSDTARYVHLQTLYKTQANSDLTRFRSILSDLLSSLGFASDDPRAEAGISEQAVEEFVKNAAFLKVVRGRSLEEERGEGGKEGGERGWKKETVMSFLPDPTWNEPYIPPPIVQYIAFQIADLFHAHHGRYPGTSPSSSSSSSSSNPLPSSNGTSSDLLEFDHKEMDSLAETYLAQRGWVKASESMKDSPEVEGEDEEEGLPKSVRDALGEMVRAGRSDLPTTAAFLGGVVAQEAIKLLTDQYVPLNNTTVVDLIRFVSFPCWFFQSSGGRLKSLGEMN
jgi:amyloid beta precursor protein binding protein 1